MPRNLIGLSLVWMALVLQLAPPGTASAQTVWSGFSHTFSKPIFGNPNMESNQDRITENVWLTRSTNQGLFNIKSEIGYVQDVSPADTEWATDLVPGNAGETIAAENWADLSFVPWVTAYGGPGSRDLPSVITSRNAVLHLITDNIYLDIRFLTWGGAGGAYSYERAVGNITPPTATGDYNQNGEVDAADYVLWRETLDQAVTPAGSGADGNMNSTVDAGDYEFWRARFGNTVPVAANATSVPEPPTALCLAILGFRGFARRTRHFELKLRAAS